MHVGRAVTPPQTPGDNTIMTFVIFGTLHFDFDVAGSVDIVCVVSADTLSHRSERKETFIYFALF